MPVDLTRADYASRYGPTAGDRVRLGDTNLVVLVERDVAVYGDEVLGGWGKTFRSGMSLAYSGTKASEIDTVITNVLVIDPVLGILKGDIGIKDGLIAGIGHAGNSDISDGIDLELGPNTIALPGQGMIATPGGIDTHMHIRSPRLLPSAMASGLTSIITGGTFQNPEFNLWRAFEAFEGFPVNLGLLGRASEARAMARQVESGVCGIKVHEDYAGYPTVIDQALWVADDYDVAVAMHTDGLNESCELSETIDAVDGRAIHAYHVEGSGGGHPDMIAIASERNVIGSSTTPTIPYGPNATKELHAMMWAVHGMNASVPSNRAMVEERIRESTAIAESILHDMGAISITNSDSQGMGRIGEIIRRTWQMAHQMKLLHGEETDHDNDRILRYVAKYTINAARTHGVDQWVGSLEPGKMADIVLWRPAFFGVKPDLVIKGGYSAWGPSGEGNATITGCEPVIYGPLSGGVGAVPSGLALTFVSEASMDSLHTNVKTQRRAVPVHGTRHVSKRDMLFNDACPKVEFDPATTEVFINGEGLPAVPTDALPLNRRYLLL